MRARACRRTVCGPLQRRWRWCRTHLLKTQACRLSRCDLAPQQPAVYKHPSWLTALCMGHWVQVHLHCILAGNASCWLRADCDRAAQQACARRVTCGHQCAPRQRDQHAGGARRAAAAGVHLRADSGNRVCSNDPQNRYASWLAPCLLPVERTYFNASTPSHCKAADMALTCFFC
jgi:hypothetical protein